MVLEQLLVSSRKSLVVAPCPRLDCRVDMTVFAWDVFVEKTELEMWMQLQRFLLLFGDFL